MFGVTVITSADKRNNEARRIAANIAKLPATPDGRFQPKRDRGHRTPNPVPGTVTIARC